MDDQRGERQHGEQRRGAADGIFHKQPRNQLRGETLMAKR
jgi:hypothetical protein